MSGWVGCSYCGYRVPVENINAPFNWNHECLPKSDNESKMTTPKRTPKEWAEWSKWVYCPPDITRDKAEHDHLVSAFEQAMAEARRQAIAECSQIAFDHRFEVNVPPFVVTPFDVCLDITKKINRLLTQEEK